MARTTRRVADVLSTALVKVPDWFTVGAALQVARLKGVESLLVVDRGAVVGVGAARVLEGAPERDPIGRWLTRTLASVSPETSVDEARALMAVHGLDCVPVIADALLVGIVTREAVARVALAA